MVFSLILGLLVNMHRGRYHVDVKIIFFFSFFLLNYTF